MLREPFILRTAQLFYLYMIMQNKCTRVECSWIKDLKIIYNKVDTSIYRPAKDKYKKIHHNKYITPE